MSGSIKFRCPNCDQKIRVAAEHAGKKGQCPKCKNSYAIPSRGTLDEHDQPIPAAQAEAEDAKSEKVEETQPLSPEEAAAQIAAKAKNGGRIARSESPPRRDPEPSPNAKTSAYIKFKCPNCENPIGFPAKMANTPKTCPSCRSKVMVPEESGGESFIVGAVAPAAAGPKSPPKPRPAGALPKHAAVIARKASEAAHYKWVAIGASTLAATVLLGFFLVYLFGDNGGEDNATGAADPAPKPAVPQSANPENPQPPAPTSVSTPAPPKSTVPPPTIPASEILGPGAEPLTVAAAPKQKGPQRTPESRQPAASGTAGTRTDPPASAQRTPELPPMNLHDRPKAAEEEEEEEPAAVVKKPLPAAPRKKPEGATAFNPLAPKPVKPEPPQPASSPAPPKPETLPPLPKPPELDEQYQPILPGRPFVHLEKTPLPPAWQWVPWKYALNYKGKRDPKVLMKEALDRLAKAKQMHLFWENKTRLAFVRVDTHHVTLHVQAKPAVALKVGLAIEKLTNILQQWTRSVELTQTRPDTHQIIILWDDASYQKLINVMALTDPTQNWNLMRQADGGMGPNLGYFNAHGGVPTGPEHMALFQFAKMSMLKATAGHAPTWLAEGFAAYSENVVTHMNLVYSFRYEKNEVRFGQNWNQDIKKFARQGKLKTWNYIFPLDLIGMKSLDYLTCYSMVSFLIKNDPKRFIKFVRLTRDGAASQAALEKVYGRRIRDLQMLWARWAMSQR